MYPPSGTITVADGGLGLVSGGTNFPLVVGVSSLGVAATLYIGTDPQAFKASVGRGPGVDLALACIEAVGGVLFLKTAGSVAAVNGTVTPTRVGTSTGTITVSGAATHDMPPKIRIKKTGTVGTGRFDYTLDRGSDKLDTDRTFSEEITIPSGGTFTVPNTGLTLTFVPGGGPTFFERDDSHTFASTCAHYNATDLGTAVTALLQPTSGLGQRKIRRVAWTGNPATAGAAATLAAAIATHMATLAANKHFARCMMDGGSLSNAATYESGFTAVFADARVAACWGLEDWTARQPVAGLAFPRVSVLHSAFERAIRSELSENLGRIRSGNCPGVVSITADENAPQLIEADKTITMRTDPSAGQGFFVTNGYLKSPQGSDFLYWDFGVLIDEGCTVIDIKLAGWKLSKVRTLKDGTGRIDPLDAKRIEQDVVQGLNDVLAGPTKDNFPQHVSGHQFSVDLTNNVLSTRNLKSVWRAIPLAPIESTATTVGLTNRLEQ